jgi:hypothetical protein
MLERHALLTSHLEQRSYWELKDKLKYDRASLLYKAGGSSPYIDLRLSFESVCQGWELRRASKRVGKSFKQKENSINIDDRYLLSEFC